MDVLKDGFASVALAVSLFFAASYACAEVVVTAARMNPDDLEVAFADGKRASVFLSRGTLYEMEAKSEKVYLPYIDAELGSTIVPLKTLIEHFGFDSSTAATAESYDGYFSLYPIDFIEQYGPYLILDLEGLERGNLHPDGAPNLGPYYITFAARLEQGSPEMSDPDNKRPYGVNKVTIGSYSDLVGIFYEGALANLSAEASHGRKLYLNNCLSCHAWASEDGPGGSFSNRTAQVLSAHAKYNQDYFTQSVVDPSVFTPDVKMPKHPHYDAEDIESIRLFLAAFSSP